MVSEQGEDQQLRATALRNVESIQAARQRAERELLSAKEALERRTEELRQQQEWLQVTLSSIGDGVIATDEGRRIVFMNPAAAEMTGWTQPEASGRSLDEVFRIGAAAEGRENAAPATTLVRRNGTRLEVTARFAPLRSADGNVGGTVVVFHDISEMLESARAARESAWRLQLALEVGKLGDWSWNAATGLTALSPRAAAILDAAPGAALTLAAFHELAIDEDRSQLKASFVRALQSRSDFSVEYRIRAADGTVRVVGCSGRASFADDGHALEITGVLQDLTEQKKFEEARSRLVAVITSSDDAIISKTLDGIITSWNQGAERIFGYSAAEAIGQPVTMLIPPDRLDEESTILARLRRGDRIDHYETVRRRKDGVLLDVSLSVSPMRDGAGVIIGASKIARDITRQRRAEQAARASEERFRLMADSAPVLIWIADTSKACTWFNSAWLEFTARSLEQELGFGWVQGIHPDDLDQFLKVYGTSFETQRPYKTEFRARRHDGQWRWLIDHALPLFEGPGRSFSGFIGSRLDITELRHAAIERERLLESERAARGEAERLGQLKDEFLATLSHELRTPLNAILGWASLLRRVPIGSADHLKGLETIERNARVQTQIIADLLDMSRILSGKVQLDVQPVNLHEVISAAMDVVRPSADAKRLRLRATLGTKATAIRGDAGRLQQVFWNLLTNAVKFTPAGGRIDIVLERVNSHVEVSIEDSGAGIKPEFLPFVFDRFRQADASITRRHGGLGLGLAIVKQLAELHGGTVRVKSPGEGKGATFIVALPISVSRVADSGRFERPDFADVDLFSIELPSLAGITVLIIDDEEDARVLTSRLVEERGARALVAESTTTALQILSSESVDILVSDIGMPDCDGYQFMRSLRAAESPRTRNIPAIALTAYARADDRQRALLAGYQMHLAKPIEPRELIAGIASLLSIPPNEPIRENVRLARHG